MFHAGIHNNTCSCFTSFTTRMYVSVRILLMRDNWSNDICYKLVVYVWFTVTLAYTVQGPGIAQLVERLTKMPGVILTQVRVPGAARDFLPQSQLSVQTPLRCPCAIACINICAHVKDPQPWQPWDCLDTRKYYIIIHTLRGVGSAACSSSDAKETRCSCGCCAFNYQGKAVGNSRMGQ